MTAKRGGNKARCARAEQWRKGSSKLRIGPLLVALCLLGAPTTASATELPSTITENTTLTAAGNPYTGSPTIASGVTVKVEPGVKFTIGTLTVKGTLKVEGTGEAPVVFTSSAKEPKAGDWSNIKFEPGSSGLLDHAEVRYAGYINSSAAIEITGASPTITHSVVRNNKWYGIRATGASSPEISYNEVKSNAWAGISYSSTASGGEVNIHDNVLEANGGGIGVTSEGSAFGRSLGNNTVISGGGVSYEGTDMPPDVSTNSLSPTAKLSLSGTVAQSATWTYSGYVFAVANNLPLTIASGATLTLKPGVVYEPESVVVKGTLKAEGTTEAPVLFTRGSAAGSWRAIKFEPGSGGLLDHTEVRYGGFNSSSPAIEILGASPTITHSVVRNNKGYGIKATGASSPEIAYNEVKNNPATGIVFNSSTTGEVNIHDNTLEGTGANISVTSSGTAVGHSLGHNTVLGGGIVAYEGSDIPPDISTNTVSETGKIAVSGTVAQSATWTNPGHNISAANNLPLTIESGATLTLQAGVVFEPHKIVVKGALKAEGSTEAPVIFAKGSTSGSWQNIKFEPGSSGLLDHAEVRYAGYINSSAAIEITGASPTITHSVVRNNKWYGIRATGASSPEISYNEVKSNAWAGISYSSTASGGEVNIHDNVLEANGGGIGVTSEGSAFGRSLGNNTVISGGGVSYEGTDMPPDVSTNSLSPTAKLSLSGTVAQSATWTYSGYVFAVANNLPLTIASGATLTLKPGVVYEPESVVVKGTLKAEGTTEAPVLFTRGSAAGSWRAIKFEPGSGGLLDHTEVRYGGFNSSSPAIEILGASPTITHSVVRNNKGYGVKVASGSPSIEWTSFRGNVTQGLNYGGAGTLSAPHNYWGCASGPRPSGCGDAVGGSVNWKPQAEEDSPLGKCRGRETQCEEGADPVSLATGFLAYSHRDLLLTNKSRLPLEFTRAYNSNDHTDSGLGPGWSQTGLASATELENGDVLVRRQDGRQDAFVLSEGSYIAPSGVTDVLTKVEGTFQLTTLERTIYRFDASGRIASITDDHGLKTTYGYDANGRLATITDPSAQTLTFSYNSSNHITLVKDSTGREAKYAYSAAGDLATVTDALGGVTEYTYDSAHRLKTIKDPRGNVILKNTYDGQGRITEQRDGLENLWALEYKAGETVVTEPEGGELTYSFDGQDRVVSEKDQLGHTTTTGYDTAGNIDEIIKPGGAKWVFGHDATGNLTSVVDPEEGERSYEYDGLNRLTSFTDERGETWSYEWDEGNDLVKVTDPAEGETTLTHDAAGLPLTVTDPNEHTSTFTYDARGNRLTAEDALEHTTTFGYNTRNHLTSTTAPGLEPETYGRNGLGDLLSVTTPEGNKTEYAYDANGMPKQITDPAEGIWKIELDAMERPTAYVDPLGKETKVEYNGNLNPVKTTDRRGKETTYAYDLANQLTEMVRPEGGDWEFDHDARGNRTEAIDPRENATNYSYDLLDRMTGAVEPLEATSSYEYDPAGNLISFTDPRENTTELTYDALGQLTEVDQPLEKTTIFTYDPAGNWLTRTTAAGTVDLEYDAANRLEEIREGETALRSYEYDAANRMTGATDTQADQINIGYDDDGRVVSLDDGRGQTVSRNFDSRGNLIEQTDGRGTLAFEYDKLSRMISLTDPQSKAFDFAYDLEGNLTKAGLPNGVVTTNEFDNAGRLADTTSTKGEAALESLEYEYDPNGNRIGQVDRLSQETTYEYDALNRLIEFDPPGEGQTVYDYDPAGNRTEAGPTSYSFNALNQLTTASNGTTYDYDDAGRLIEVAQGESSTTYGWNILDELTSADTGAEEIDYAYDALGRQVLRENGSTIRPSHYGDLSDLPILDTDAEGEPTMSYVQGPEGLIEQRSGEATSFPLRDAHGDITTLADGEGEVASRQTYDPWGERLSGPSLEMGWLGAQQRRSDSATGLVQMGIRSYAPTFGRFLTEDPVAVTIGMGQLGDRYTYAANTPPNLTDLTGRSIFEDIADGGGGMIESFVDDPLGYPRGMVSEAQEYWVNSDNPLANVAGPAVSIVDLAVNPDRLDYYMKSNNLPQKEQLADCYNGGHPARTIGGLAGGAGGFVAGTSSAAGDLGARSVGVGAVSGGAGAAIGAGIGTVGGCAFGVVSGLID